jgi:hypothetical protein
MMRRIAETIDSLRALCELFYRCGTGLAWFWPAQPPGRHPVVGAWRMTRWQSGDARRA